MSGNYKLSDVKRQEKYSLAYIGAISSVAGYSVDDVEVDEDSIDFTINQRADSESDGEDYPLIEGLKVQLKCTFAHQPNPNTNSIHLTISRKNYQDLIRARTVVPRILVVLYTPREFDAFLNHADFSMELLNTAHWLCLRGWESLPEGQNSIVVRVPLNQRFTVSTLRGMMDCLATTEQTEMINNCFGEES